MEANPNIPMFDETIADRVRPLAEAFKESGLARMTVRDAGFELELRAAVRAPAVGSLQGAAPPAADAPPQKPDMVTADVVGVVRFMRPQLAEGQALDADRELAFVEALGIRNPVRSRGAGKIAAIFVTDGQPVEYGQPLFAIERA